MPAIDLECTIKQANSLARIRKAVIAHENLTIGQGTVWQRRVSIQHHIHMQTWIG